MRLKRVDKVFNNPYRVLGLVSPITSKELAKRTSDLETFIDFGKVKEYSLDMNATNSTLIRTVESVKDAARSIESDSDKVFNALFWFYQYDSVDEIAFEAIKSNNYIKAYDLWDSRISSSTQPKFSWLINANVLSFFDMESSGFSYDTFYSVIERYMSIAYDLEKIKDDLLQSNKNTVDKITIGQKLIDSLIEYATRSDEGFLNGNSLELLNAFSGYEDVLEDYAKSKIINPYTNEIEDVIKEVEQGLDEENSWAIYGLVEKLKDKEFVIRELDLYCSDYKIQRLVNDYAETAKRCSVFAHNIIEETDFAKEIIDWASELPAYGETKNDILDNQNKLNEIMEDASISKTFSKVVECLDKDIYSYADAQWLLSEMLRELKAVHVQGHKEEEVYRSLAGACVFKLLNKILEIYKDTFDSFKDYPDIDKLNTTIIECHSLISRIQREFMYIDIETEAQEYINKAYTHISEEKSDIQQFSQNIKKKKYVPAVDSEKKPLIGGVLYGVSNITGINLGYLRVGYVIATLFFSVPLLVVYGVLLALKVFVENNAK